MMDNFPSGLLRKNLEQLVELLKGFNLLSVPGIWSEDATTSVKRLTASLDHCPEGIDVLSSLALPLLHTGHLTLPLSYTALPPVPSLALPLFTAPSHTLPNRCRRPTRRIQREHSY